MDLPLRPLRLPVVHPEARSNNQRRSGSAAFRMGVIPKRVTDSPAQRSGRSQAPAPPRSAPARAPWRPLQAFRAVLTRAARVLRGAARTPNGFTPVVRASTAPRAAETRAECPADGVPTPARSRTRSRERQSSTACAVAGRQFDTGRRNPNRPGLAGSARLVAPALTKVRFESTARARPRSFLWRNCSRTSELQCQSELGCSCELRSLRVQETRP